MATYAIGDVQGCFAGLQNLLKLIHFQENEDRLWFVGDLVNRGPASLEVLRFVKNLGDKHITVLGNHDLHLLAVQAGTRAKHPHDTLDAILKASDCDELCAWLTNRPLLHYDEDRQLVMVHAGLAPQWTLEKARELAKEVEDALRGEERLLYFREMYGNQPNNWSDALYGVTRLRCITNYLVRMRYCYADGSLELKFKGKIQDKPSDLIPWYHVPRRQNKEVKIIFGHWAALEGKVDVKNLYAIDTGCVWGKSLTALRLEDGKRFSAPC